MDEGKLFEEFLSTTYTQESFYRRLRLLRSYLEARFFSSAKELSCQEYIAREGLSLLEAQDLQVAWNESFEEGASQETVYSVLDKFQTLGEDLPVLRIYLPFSPLGGSLERIGSWVRKNVDGKVLLSPLVDRSLVAGAILVWQGKRVEFSVRQFLSGEGLKDIIHAGEGGSGE